MSKNEPGLDEAPVARGRYWLGPIIILLALSIYKSLMMGGISPRSAYFFKLDLPLIGLSGTLCLLAGVMRPKILRLPVHLIIMASLIVFATHVVSLVLFDQNLTVQNVVDFAPEWKWDITFIKWFHILIFLGALAVYFIRIWISRLTAHIILFLSPVVIALGLWPLPDVPQDMAKYMYDARDVRALLTPGAKCRASFTPNEVEAAEKELAKSSGIRIADPKPNIILVIVESLSAVDSSRISGIRNILPRLDRVAENGMLFTNFFANYYQTNGAFVGLLNQTAPVPFPESKVPMLSAFSTQQSVPREFKKQGYHTEMLLNGPLWFENVRNYAPRVGYDVVEGYDEIERYQNKPTFTCGVPGDEWLFEEAAERAAKYAGKKDPFFLTLLTTSSHVPFVDPLRRKNTEENVFDYVDQQLERLYQLLKDAGFFEKGVLMIAGDHRKPTPVGPREWEKWGETAKARVPLVVIGAGIPKGVVDTRFFQQAELFRRFNDIRDVSKPLSSYAVFVDHYSRLVWQDSPKGNLVIYRPGETGNIENYKAIVDGTCFTWTGAKPKDFEKIERTIQVERAMHQGTYVNAPATCQVTIDPRTRFSQSDNGIEARLFEGKDMNGFLDASSSRFLGKKAVQSVDFENFNGFSGADGKTFSAEFLGAISVPETGQYWFNVESADGVCLSIDKQKIIDAGDDKPVGEIAGHALLTKGRHVFVLRSNGGNNKVKLTWIPRPDRNFWTRSEKKQWQPVPKEAFFVPTAP